MYITDKTYNHTPQAIEVQRATGWNLDEYAEEMGWAGVGIGPVGRHRDSDLIAESNWAVVTEGTSRHPAIEGLEVHRFGHWAVGWVEELAYDTGNTAVCAAVAEVRKRLEGYPILDEDHHSQVECEDADRAWDSWGCNDFTRALVAKFPTLEDAIDALGDKTYDLFHDACEWSNTNWEDDGNGMSINIARVVAVIDAEDIPGVDAHEGEGA